MASDHGVMRLINLSRVESTPLARDPFDHIILPDLIDPRALGDVIADFPEITQPGSFPLADLRSGPVFAALARELTSAAMTDALGTVFGVGIADFPRLVTVRGVTRKRDGAIHTDSRGKVVTLILYLNAEWHAEGGRLRLLRGPHDIGDYAAEIAPRAGTALAFRRSRQSYHGHRPYEGPRRSLQVSWVANAAYLAKETRRHRVAARIKRLFPRARAMA